MKHCRTIMIITSISISINTICLGLYSAIKKPHKIATISVSEPDRKALIYIE